MANRIDGDLVERALALLDVTPGCVCDYCQNAPGQIKAIIAEARQREREACADIATEVADRAFGRDRETRDLLMRGQWMAADRIAAKIRFRSALPLTTDNVPVEPTNAPSGIGPVDRLP